MMYFKKIFSVFSNRSENLNFKGEISATFRNRVIMLVNDQFANSQSGDYREIIWNEIHHRIKYRVGYFQLSERHPTSVVDDLMSYLFSCTSLEFLDFIEDIFQVQSFFRSMMNEDEFVETINLFFEKDNLNYYLTDYVREEIIVRQFGQDRKSIKTVQYPMVILKDNQVSHSLAITPTLELLSNPIFKTANEEFLEALKDYREGDYRDCLTKCGSSFESVMKIICAKKKWKYREQDSASILVEIMIQNTKLDSCFQTVLIIIATLRNKLSKSHGAGTKTKVVETHLAEYAINSTASAILLLVQETKM